VIEPWNVTEAEVAVAESVGIPINGTSPALWSVGFKSEGRRLFRSADVPVPFGVEDLRSRADVLEAVTKIRAGRPAATGAILKLDDSGAGDGNVVLDLRDPDLPAVIDRLPDWYVSDLAGGGVLEERITGTAFSSPSAQIDVLPDGGGVRVLATHEQVLGGADAQVYMGCRFPADPAYAAVLARHAVATGEALAARGVVGRVAVDFAAARDAGGRWSVHALEINLRKGGTTHPYTALRSLVPGSYDTERGRWVAEDGTAREYSATDNLVNPAWLGMAPRHAIDAIAAAGLAFDSAARTGVVLHMLSGLAIDGRLGLIAIGRNAADAKLLHEAAARAIHAAAR
jgi:hypothetical protein